MFNVRNNASWPILSAILLALYLLFFHVAMWLPSYAAVMTLGAICWAVWIWLCRANAGSFANRADYWFHQVVGIDLLLEGINPFHEGFGFYFCAAAFWAVLIAYHCFAYRKHQQSATTIQPSLDETDS